MSISIQFYNVFITHNGLKTDISISDYIDQIRDLDEEDRYKEGRKSSYSLLYMAQPDPNDFNTFDDRKVTFGDYRERKPFLGNRRTDRIDDITDDVVELTSAVFIPRSFQMVVQYNHFGARSNNIEEYLSKFLPRDDEQNSWGIEVIEISTSNAMNKIRRTNRIKSVEVTLNIRSEEMRNIIANMDEEEMGLIETLQYNAFGVSREYNASTASFSFGQGRYRNDTMDTAALIQILEDLDFESEAYAAIYVDYVNPDTNKPEKVNLKNEGVLKREILDDPLLDLTAHEIIADTISDSYYQQWQRLGRHFYQGYELVPVDFPGIYVPELLR
ncbi:hypothetical protein CHH58_16120 [Terribacillus saccharophilus]|uniref:DUF6731 family protein n=1 Tax=Terribacillus saccharophilus TaxID=361277 RepID=UPI000BA5A6F5|nr:DUF6731 family protein [Terribacillus saccharophilus]PAF35580.1 hypothetical protein CHH58_16120 [Terribacillus saccharophilus]